MKAVIENWLESYFKLYFCKWNWLHLHKRFWILYLMLYVKRLRSTCFCNLKSLLIIQVIRFLRKRFFVKVKSSFSLKFCGLLTSTTSNQQVAKNLFFVSKIDLVMHETFFAICKHCVIFAESWRRDLESFIKNN